MDVLTLRMTLKAIAEEGTDTDAQIDALEAYFNGEDMDGDIAFKLLLNAFRQHKWQNEADAPVCEYGTVSLTNTQAFPFNNSQQTVALGTIQKNIKYAVVAEITSANGNPGEVVVSGKQTNGFKLAYTGSASSAVVEYIVIGGIIA